MTRAALLRRIGLLLFACCAHNAAAADEALKALGNWMAHYYQAPAPEAFPGWIEKVAAAGVFSKAAARPGLLSFSAEVIRRNPDRTRSWCHAFSSLPAPAPAYLAWAFLSAATPVAEQCARTGLGQSESWIDSLARSAANQSELLALGPRNPADLDALWAIFFASGEAEAVKRIIDVLAYPEPRQGIPGQLEMQALQSAAKWSLTSNIRQHPRVREIALGRREHGNPRLAAALEQILPIAPAANAP